MSKSSDRQPNIRRTARLILLNQQNQALLIKIEDKTVVDPTQGVKKRPFWITPGGKMEEGETHNEALLRELREETGIADTAAVVGKCIGVGEHDLIWKGVPTHLHESFFVVRVVEADVSVAGMMEDEKAVYRNHKWWSLEELNDTSEIFIPLGLAKIIAQALAGEIPDEPIKIDMTTPRELTC